VKKCEACQRHQPLKRVEPIRSILAEKPFERIQMDAIEMRKFTAENDGYNWILNIVDVYSKLIFAFALKTKSAEDVRNCLRFLITVGVKKNEPWDKFKILRINIL